MIVIALWIFFALFMTLVVSIVANALYPMGQTASAGQILDNYSCQMSLNRLSPYYLYSEAVSTIMNPMVRSRSPSLLDTSMPTMTSTSTFISVLNIPENQSIPIRIAILSNGSPSEEARKVYTITEPPGTTIVPMHIRH